MILKSINARKIVGFARCAIDIQLVVYLLESAVNLEKIVINPCSPYIMGIPCPKNERTTAKYKGAREAAKRLKEKLLTDAEFVILSSSMLILSICRELELFLF